MWKVPLACCHEIGKSQTLWLIHLLSMALAILIAPWRMSSTNIFLASNNILKSLNLMALIEYIIRRHVWLICVSIWILKNLRNCRFWVMYASGALSLSNLLSCELNLASFRTFETLVCLIYLLIKRQSSSTEQFKTLHTLWWVVITFDWKMLRGCELCETDVFLDSLSLWRHLVFYIFTEFFWMFDIR